MMDLPPEATAPASEALDASFDRAVVVANPSSVPEIAPATSALAARRMLSRYYVPVATTPAHESTVKRWVPARLRGPILTELRRRPILLMYRRLRATSWLRLRHRESRGEPSLRACEGG